MLGDTIHIVFCTDMTYIMPVGVAIISICENNRNEDLFFHISVTVSNKTTQETSNDEIAQLADIAKQYNKSIKFYYVDEELLSSFSCRGSQYISTTAFARIFLPNILSEDITKIIYLDGDIAVTGSLRELWDFDLSPDCPIAGAIDVFGLSASYRTNVKIPLDIPYINSGVLIMNLDVWRRNSYSQKCIDCANEHRFPLLDQDTLNYIFRDSIALIPLKYNVQTHYLYNESTKKLLDYRYVDEMNEAVKAPVIIHYVSSNKPWLNENCMMREYWEQYFNLSAWKNTKITKEINCLFEYSFIYKSFIDAYWSDSNLMKESLLPFLRLFNAILRFKNKMAILKYVAYIINGTSCILELIYRIKRKISSI